jgi:hypothetical protein
MRLEVAVDDLLLVEVSAAPGDVEGDRSEPRLVLQEASLLAEEVRQAAAVHELGDYASRLGADADHLDHVGMVQLSVVRKRGST